MAALAPLVGQVAGVERRPISFEIDGLTRTVRAGGLIDQACTGVASGIDSAQAIGLDNTAHPVNSRLSLAKATRSSFHAFGFDWDDSTGTRNGHIAPFSWTGQHILFVMGRIAFSLDSCPVGKTNRLIRLCIVCVPLSVMTAQTVLTDSSSLPENFRALVYSKTAAELFWDRADTPGLVYQISRDSTLIGETDGTSFFVDDLSDARGHDFTVQAVDAAGTTSTASNVFVNTETPEDPVNPPRDDTGVLKNEKMSVYSENAAELSWDHPSVSDDVVSVEVLRNEESVGTTYGTSYYDDTRTPNSNQSYQLQAIDSNGE